MREISTGLNEVVVVGYGSQKRASIVGSITTIEPQVLSQGTTRALSNNLAGNVAGVIAVQRSGEPVPIFGSAVFHLSKEQEPVRWYWSTALNEHSMT